MQKLAPLATVELSLAIMSFVADRRVTAPEIEEEFRARFFSQPDILTALSLLIERNELLYDLEWKLRVNSWKPEIRFSEVRVFSICSFREPCGRMRKVIKLPFSEVFDRPWYPRKSINAVDVVTEELCYIEPFTMVKSRDIRLPVSS